MCVISGGQAQRIAIARAAIRKPDWPWLKGGKRKKKKLEIKGQECKRK